ncbi:peptidase U32 [Tissierellia bacterium S7-1-4]|uniref:peptidase U32 family protein n=1 Tax=Ezakiella coagulans TaxID=46507 RepID=UPI00050E9C26|nr:U32 family peptidase [Ezakiella coagulans]KGF08156.1 peptidase U32 [Tissierellia bacterium S7-1-4]UQK60520.1 U32 family peptidase [Ezakiella coagulans]
MIELLAPAGDLSRMKTAFMYGADACYIGGIEFGLRKAATNFTRDDLKEAVEFANKNNKKIYVTLNIIPHEGDFDGMVDYIKFLDEIGVHAVIVSDPGVFSLVKENSNLQIHISTQGSVTNSNTINFWHKMGASRVVLARELSLEEIATIRKNIAPEMELEAFCHGAMCMSYSGRCLMSSYMTGRDPNKGDCAHPCRYKYYLMEEKRPGEYFPIEETEGGTYIMNSKDMKTISFVEKLIEAGITSLKIEGRVKSAYYIATVVRAYRRAIDSYLKDPENYKFDESLDKEVISSSHRPFTSGFYFGNPMEDGQYNNNQVAIPKSTFKGEVHEAKDGRIYFTLKNGLNEGETVSVMGPEGDVIVEVKDLRNDENKHVERANVPQTVYSFLYDKDASEGFYIRQVEE